LVRQAGERPYVVAPAGQIELASRGLTLEAVDGIVGQLLPPELQRALDEFGAVQYELPAAPEFPREHFTVVAARGGDDLWTEIRRRRVPAEDDHVSEDLFPPRGTPPGAAAAVAAPPAISAPATAPPAVAPPMIASPIATAAAAAPSAVASVVTAPLINAPPPAPPLHAGGATPVSVTVEQHTIADVAPLADAAASTRTEPVAYRK